MIDYFNGKDQELNNQSQQSLLGLSELGKESESSQSLSNSRGLESEISTYKQNLSINPESLSPSPNGGYGRPRGKARILEIKGSDACPICGSSDGRCRSTDENYLGFILCMGIHLAKGDSQGGYKSLGESRDGLWTQYILAGQAHDREYLKNLRIQRKKERESLLAQEISNYQFERLSNEELDFWGRRIAREQGLSPNHRKILKARGMTDSEIDKLPYFSIRAWAPIDQECPISFPGISIDKYGKKILGTISNEGLAIPTMQNGLCLGFQILLDKREEGGPKYLFLSNGKDYRKIIKDRNGKKQYQALNSLKLANGENPMGFYPGENPSEIWHIEGNLKGQIAHNRHGISVLAAPGGLSIRSSGRQISGNIRQCQEILKDAKIIIICLDGGDLKNDAVFRRNWATIQAYQQIGLGVLISYWGQDRKEDHRDIDEISDLKDVQFLTPKQYKTLHQKKAFDPRTSMKSRYNFSPDRIIDSQYFPSSLIEDPKGKILGIKSPMGTGKSQSIGSALGALVKARPSQGIIGISFRKSLCDALAGSWNIRYGLGLEIIHCDSDVKEIERKIKQGHNRWIVQADSLQKLLPLLEQGKLGDYLVVIDEATTVIDFLFSSTSHIAKVREAVLKTFKLLCQNAGGFILADANLNDETIQFIESLSGLKSYRIINEFKGRKTQYYRIRSVTEIIGMIRSQAIEGKKLFVLTDSKSDADALHESLMEVGQDGICITRDSSHDYREFMKDPKGYLENSKIQYIIASPSIQSGIDISFQGFFDATFGIFKGVLGPEDCLQMLGRLRDPGCPRFIFFQEIGRGFEYQFSSECCLEQIIIRIEKILERCPADNELLKELIRNNREAIQAHPIYSHEARIRSQNNLSKFHFGRCLEILLERSGFEFKGEISIPKEEKWSLKQIKDEIAERLAENLLDSDDIADEIADRLEKKQRTSTLNLQEKGRLARHGLRKRCPDIFDDEKCRAYWGPLPEDQIRELRKKFIARAWYRSHKKAFGPLERRFLASDLEGRKILEQQDLNLKLGKAARLISFDLCSQFRDRGFIPRLFDLLQDFVQDESRKTLAEIFSLARRIPIEILHCLGLDENSCSISKVSKSLEFFGWRLAKLREKNGKKSLGKKISPSLDPSPNSEEEKIEEDIFLVRERFQDSQFILNSQAVRFEDALEKLKEKEAENLQNIEDAISSLDIGKKGWGILGWADQVFGVLREIRRNSEGIFYLIESRGRLFLCDDFCVV